MSDSQRQRFDEARAVSRSSRLERAQKHLKSHSWMLLRPLGTQPRKVGWFARG